MIETLKEFVLSPDFVFSLVVVGFIIVVALLLLEKSTRYSKAGAVKSKDQGIDCRRLFRSFRYAGQS